MQTLFIASEDCKREFNRCRAHGYKSIQLADGVAGADAVVVAEDGDKLIINKTEYCEGEEEVYIIACKSFGLVSRSLDTKVSVVFCDDDEMLDTYTPFLIYICMLILYHKKSKLSRQILNFYK